MALPPIVATLLADTKEFSAKMDQAAAKMDAFGNSAKTNSQKFSNFANKAADAIIGVGVAIGAYGVDRAIKYEDALLAIQNQTGATASEMDYLKRKVIEVSNETATSTDQIAAAYLIAEQAGYRGKKATDLVTASAKTAAITNADLATTTKDLVAIKTLGLAKDQSQAKVADTLVKANQKYVGSLDGLAGMLSGKVGAALSQYHVSLGDTVAIGDIFSHAGFTQTRSIAALVSALGQLQQPLETYKQTHKTVTEHVKQTALVHGVLEHRVVTLKKQLTSTTPVESTFAKNLDKVGLSAANLAHEAAKPGGLINVLSYLERQSKATGTSASEYLNAVFGRQSAPAANILISHLSQLKDISTTLGTASGKGLNSSFDTLKQQLPFKLKQIETQLQNSFTAIGLDLLPAITDIANWATDVGVYFDKHPLIKTIASDSALSLFGAAVAFKIAKGLGSAVSGIKSIFTGSAITTNTGALGALTDAVIENTAAQGGGAVAGGAEGAAIGTGEKVAIGAAAVSFGDVAGPIMGIIIGAKIGKALGNPLTTWGEIANTFLGHLSHMDTHSPGPKLLDSRLVGFAGAGATNAERALEKFYGSNMWKVINDIGGRENLKNWMIDLRTGGLADPTASASLEATLRSLKKPTPKRSSVTVKVH